MISILTPEWSSLTCNWGSLWSSLILHPFSDKYYYISFLHPIETDCSLHSTSEYISTASWANTCDHILVCKQVKCNLWLMISTKYTLDLSHTAREEDCRGNLVPHLSEKGSDRLHLHQIASCHRVQIVLHYGSSLIVSGILAFILRKCVSSAASVWCVEKLKVL